MKSVLTVPFVSLVPKELSADLAKVRKVLSLYADHRQKALGALTLLDVCDDAGGLGEELDKFVDGLHAKRRQERRSHETYRREIKSRLRRLIRDALTTVESPDGDSPYLLHVNVPPFLHPILHLLPRKQYFKNGVSSPDADGEEQGWRLDIPLTDNGRALLAAILSVVERHQLATVESVLVDHGEDVLASIKALCPPKQWRSTIWSLRMLRKHLNFPIFAKPPKQYVALEDWPPTLRNQAERFLELATAGPDPNSTLVTLAAKHGLTLGSLERRTRVNYIKAVAKSLSFIPYDGDLDVVDLLTLRPVSREVRPGVFTDVLHNPLVDVFREHEINLETDRKRRGYDSDIFQTFITAIKTIAAFNGICDLQKSFNAAYTLNKDKVRKKEVKAFKKRAFDLEWIDGEIERLGREFYRVIRAGTFKLENESVGLNQRRKNLRLCAFYVVLVTLRYMGYRQQCIRDCVVGKHIVFGRDGSITFRWEPNEVKNDKELTARLTKKDHGQTHGVLIDALLAYRRHVHPYLRRLASGHGMGQFFLKLGRANEAGSFATVNETIFGIQFKSGAFEFLDFGGRLSDPKRGFHPHHLRGLCTDWLYYVLGLSLEEISQIIGDAVETLRDEYLDKDKPYDASPVLSKANKAIRAEQAAEKTTALEAVIDGYRTTVAQKEEQLNTLLQELRVTNERMRRVEAERDAQTVQLEAARAEVASLREQGERHHREMMDALRGNGRAAGGGKKRTARAAKSVNP